MNRIKQFLYLIYCCIGLTACNSNALRQENAEKTINEFLTTQGIKTSEVELSPATVQKIGKTNIYSQFHTSVTVDFKSNEDQSLRLLFDFTRTPKNKWFLKSVEEVDGASPELENWLKDHKKLNIAAQ